MDWSRLLTLGLRDLKLSPSEFWALTPYECLLMLGHVTGPAPMLGARLTQLAQLYPDQEPHS